MKIEQVRLHGSRLLRTFAFGIYAVAPRQSQASLHCTQLLSIFVRSLGSNGIWVSVRLMR